MGVNGKDILTSPNYTTMNLQLQNKVFIVTGGASGIGAAICRLITAEEGIAVIVDRNAAQNEALLQELQQAGRQAKAMQAELTNEADCKAVVDNIIATYGRIDGLVNNAGVNDGVSLENGSVEGFNRSLDVSLVHYFAMAHYALPHLKKSRGCIVNIGSKVSITGQGKTSGYAASKGAINALTREWAAELLPYGLRVNTVVPAEVSTPQYETWIQKQPNPTEKLRQIASRIPLGKRFTTPEEIANTVVFLLSDVSSHTTGQIIFVDGGYTHLDRSLT
jgi:L-fucose dehydrogenase